MLPYWQKDFEGTNFTRISQAGFSQKFSVSKNFKFRYDCEN